MKIWDKFLLLLILFISFLSIHQSGFAAEIEADVLQVKLNRLYFNAGTEKYIFKGCRFWILQNTDTLYTGKIQQVYEGVAISEQIEGLPDSLSVISLSALIECAEVDSISMIRIMDGLAGSNYADITGSTIFGSSQEGNLKETYSKRYYGNDKPPHKVDGILSYVLDADFNEYPNFIETEYPFVAVMMPNLSKDINRNGMLTTSVYYRYSEDIIPYLFEADKIVQVSRLYPSDSSCERAFENDPEKGKQLATNLKKITRQLDFYLHQEHFEAVTNYIADILSRDQFDLNLVDDKINSDILIEFIPYDKTDPVKSLSMIIGMLSEQQPRYESQKETLKILLAHLESARDAQTEILRDYYLKLVDYSLKYDLGIFPLFRPTVYFQYNRMLTNCSFGENGELNWDTLRKLKLPESITGVEK